MKKDDLKTKIDHIKIKANSFLVVKVGTDARPASKADLDDVIVVFKEMLDGKFPDLPVIVTHSSIDVQLFTCK